MRILVAAAAVAAVAGWAGAAAAHAFLKTAMPPVGASLQQAPSEVVIDFTQGVEPGFSSITVQDASGGRVDVGAVHAKDGNTHLAIGLKPLPPGAYKVIWHATSVDTHKTEGDYTFTVIK